MWQSLDVVTRSVEHEAIAARMSRRESEMALGKVVAERKMLALTLEKAEQQQEAVTGVPVGQQEAVEGILV